MEPFDGFKPSFVECLILLRSHDETWLDANKARVEKEIFRPAIAFLESLKQAVAPFSITHLNKTKACECVMHARRNETKGTSAAIHPGYIHLRLPNADLGPNDLSLHFVLGGEGFGIGCGIQQLSDNQKKKLEVSLADKFQIAEFTNALKLAETGGCFLEKSLSVELKNLSIPQDDFSTYSGLMIRNRNEPYTPEFFEPEISDIVAERLQKIVPFENWLAKHVT